MRRVMICRDNGHFAEKPQVSLDEVLLKPSVGRGFPPPGPRVKDPGNGRIPDTSIQYAA